MYSESCMDVKTAISNRKSEILQKQILDCNGDQKKTFKIVDTLLGQNKHTTLPKYDNNNFIGYTHLFQIRGKNKVGGGVSMFIDNRINYIYRDDIKLDLEFVDVLAKGELHTKNNILIISLYRPPSIQVKLFTEKFTDILQFLSKENKYIIIVGHFNMDTSSAITNPNINVNNFQNMFLSYFYSPLIDKFTRVDEKRRTSSLLDNVFTRMLLILQMTLKVDFLKHRSRITIQYFVLQT